jgi:putative thioredoxin
MNADILEVAESNFDLEVVRYSMETPVVVDFWAPWCGPCRLLSPIVEKLAVEAGGAFRLAKVNVDDNPALSARFGVQSIPILKAFQQGKIVAELLGAQPEEAVRKFLRALAPGPAEQALSEAAGWLTARHWSEAEQSARRALELDRASSAAALYLVKALLWQGKGTGALEQIRQFPPGRELISAQRLEPLAALLVDAASRGDHAADENEAGYLQVGRLLGRGNFPAALDGLLGLLRRDKHYRNDDARGVFLAVLELLGEGDPLTRPYRDELASIIF